MRPVIAAPVLIPAPLSKKDDLINKGDYVIYSVTGTVGDQEVKGAVRIKVVSKKDYEYEVEVVPRGVPFMKKARLKFPWNGSSLADLGGVVAGWSVLHDGERIGREKIPTPFGEKEVERYLRIEQRPNGALKTEQFVDPEHRLPFGARMSGKSGDVLFGIIETDIKWIKEPQRR